MLAATQFPGVVVRYPGAQPAPYLDGSLPADRGFDPLVSSYFDSFKFFPNELHLLQELHGVPRLRAVLPGAAVCSEVLILPPSL